MKITDTKHTETTYTIELTEKDLFTLRKAIGTAPFGYSTFKRFEKLLAEHGLNDAYNKQREGL